jgi:multidrug efflux pump subunit AcrA (membrane-fusion protein)
MLRICLVLVIVVALAALGFSQKVATTLSETRTELSSATESLQTAQRSLQTAQAGEKKAKTEAADVRNQLETTQSALEDAQAKAAQQSARADDEEKKKNEALGTLNTTQAELAEFRAFGRTPQQIRETIVENQRLVTDMAAVSKENVVLDREVFRLKNRVALYEGEKVKVELPAGLRGKVLAVDPKYDFVVLSVGGDDGALERGEMLVNRGGKLVAKVRIMSVQSKRCVANVLPDWKQADVLEGDSVTVGL